MKNGTRVQDRYNKRVGIVLRQFDDEMVVVRWDAGGVFAEFMVNLVVLVDELVAIGAR